ncbi:MAG: PP2C family serine/threonine-protein phosphatase [Eubacteriales bacterium]|nr:PP2C family serine/threonine-protein phosphatase [Eubacteriales bacterium]
MNREIYGESVRGASHIRNDVVCQDSRKVEIVGDIALIAVADGHGSASCPYSKTGSVIAANVFCRVMHEFAENFADHMEVLLTYLNREGELKVAQAIDAEWKRRVWKVHTENKREKPLNEDGEVDKQQVYKQYGTTLLGLMITPAFIFAFQLGDGDIIYVDSAGVQPVIEGDKILGTETHSLCKGDAWRNALTMIRMREITGSLPHLYFISTDGFANSYPSQEEFLKTCRDYFALIREHGFEVIPENLKNWLTETSALGCGDDITAVLAYFY